VRYSEAQKGTAARFEAIPVETAVKRGFSFSTGRREAAGGHHLDRRASKLIQIMPAIKSAQPSTALTKSR